MDINVAIDRFQKLFKEELVVEAFSSYTYTIPKDKEEMLFDFYMSTLLSDTGYENADYALEEMKKLLYSTLREEMLLAVGYAIASEMDHFRIDNWGKIEAAIRTEKDFDYIFKEIKQKYGLKFASAIGDFLEPRRSIKKAKLSQPQLKIVSGGGKRSRLPSYIDAISAFKHHGLTFADFVDVSEFVFSFDKRWEFGYGGKAWENIAKGWKRLNEAKTRSDTIVAIDHIYDLQHNNDTVFDKVRSYYKKGDLEWLQNALDYKARIKEPHELYDHISPQLKSLAAYIIRKNYGKTLEDFLNEKERKSIEFNPMPGDVIQINKRGMKYLDVEFDGGMNQEFVVLAKFNELDRESFSEKPNDTSEKEEGYWIFPIESLKKAKIPLEDMLQIPEFRNRVIMEVRSRIPIKTIIPKLYKDFKKRLMNTMQEKMKVDGEKFKSMMFKPSKAKKK